MQERGRRERKKLETRAALRAAARELALERSLSDLTVEDITERADVSVRTFFNYFSCKEEAIVGVESQEFDAIAAALLARPSSEGPVDALLAVFDADGDHLVSWAGRVSVGEELVRRHPTLRSRRLDVIVEFEQRMVGALGERLGLDARTDVYPTAVVAAVLAVMRSTHVWWRAAGEPGPYHVTLERAVDPLRLAFGAGFVPSSARPASVR